MNARRASRGDLQMLRQRLTAKRALRSTAVKVSPPATPAPPLRVPQMGTKGMYIQWTNVKRLDGTNIGRPRRNSRPAGTSAERPRRRLAWLGGTLVAWFLQTSLATTRTQAAKATTPRHAPALRGVAKWWTTGGTPAGIAPVAIAHARIATTQHQVATNSAALSVLGLRAVNKSSARKSAAIDPRTAHAPIRTRGREQRVGFCLILLTVTSAPPHKRV